MPKKNKLTELQDLFIITHGNKFDLNKMNQCSLSDKSIAFIGRSGEENGIVAFVEEVKDQAPFEKGLITVALGGSALSSFIQPMRFYTGQNMDVLNPKTEMTLDEKLYYCLCIEANRFRYSAFGREANRTLHRLLLPNKESLPEWVNGATTRGIEVLSQDLHFLMSQ